MRHNKVGTVMTTEVVLVIRVISETDLMVRQADSEPHDL
jgi:hypothetical protein